MRYVILGVLLGLYLLKLSGFCFSQWAYVKDGEIILLTALAVHGRLIRCGWPKGHLAG